MNAIDITALAAVTGGVSAARKAACTEAWINDIPSQRRDWGRASAAYFNQAHPNPNVCEAGRAPVSSYWGPAAAARTIASGTSYYPVR